MFPFFERNLRVLADDPAITMAANSVYVALAIHADDKTGVCCIPRTVIAKHARCSVRTVVNAIRELSERGYIQKISRTDITTKGRIPNLYILPELTKPYGGRI